MGADNHCQFEYSFILSIWDILRRDGRTSFGLPDLRGRSPISMGRAPGLSNYIIGQIGGFETVGLINSQLPSHTHAASVSNLSVTTTSEGYIDVVNAGANSDSPSSGQYIAGGGATIFGTKGAFNQLVQIEGLEVSSSSTVSGGDVSVGETGSNQRHENRPPFLVVNWQVVVDGIYPSRS
ncbi:phage tail protein [Vibrio variabilis]|uniref:phage tail protein n=1 Tax=Vibrio variabilis TaxID=990271 RepID=UPI001EFA088B|nr:microcystin-dependent protein [Vibrio variabilis]